MKQRVKKIVYTAFVIWLMMFLRKIFIHSVILTAMNAILGAGLITSLLAIVVSAVVTGVIISYMMYRLYREDGEERRAFLKYFSENRFDKYADMEYILNMKEFREGLILFCIALFIYIAFEFGLLLIISFMYIIDVMLIFGIVFGIELLFEIYARRKLHEKWESERLHK